MSFQQNAVPLIPEATQQALCNAAPSLLVLISVSFLGFLARALFSLEIGMLVSVIAAQLTGTLVVLLIASYYLERSEKKTPAQR